MRNIKLALLAILLTFGVNKSVHALTLSQIRTEVRIRIKDVSSSRQRYSDSQLNNLINQTQKDAVNFSWIIKKSTTIALALNTTYYTLPTDIIAIHRVMFQNYNIPEVTLQTLDSNSNFGTWPLTKGTPIEYFQDPSQSTKIGVYPWPSASSSTGTLTVIYFSQATDLSGDSDIPFNSEVRYYPYHDILIYEPCYKVFLIEGEMDKATEYKSYYENRMQLITNLSNSKPNFNPGFSGQRK